MSELRSKGQDTWFRRMTMLAVWLGVLAPSYAGAGQPTVVGNEDIQLTFQAGTNGPRVLRMTSSANDAWEGEAPAALIDRAVVDGTSIVLHWQLECRRQSHAGQLGEPGL